MEGHVSTHKGAESPRQTCAVVDGEATKDSPNKLISASSAIMQQHMISSKKYDRTNSECSSFEEESTERALVHRSIMSPSSRRTTRSTPPPPSSSLGTECAEDSTGEYARASLNTPSQTNDDNRTLLVTTTGIIEVETKLDDEGSVAGENEGVIPHDHDREEVENENSVGDNLDSDSQSIPRHGALQAKWEHMFDRLVDFKEKNGHCLVPNRYSQDTSLGAWVSTQRRQSKILVSSDRDAKSTNPMTPERARRLDTLGFVWSTTDPRHIPWDKRLEELIAYKKKWGNTCVPIGYKDNPQLGNWVSTQRQEMRVLKLGRSSRLDEDRVKALDDLEFSWEAPRGGSRKRVNDGIERPETNGKRKYKRVKERERNQQYRQSHSGADEANNEDEDLSIQEQNIMSHQQSTGEFRERLQQEDYTNRRRQLSGFDPERNARDQRPALNSLVNGAFPTTPLSGIIPTSATATAAAATGAILDDQRFDWMELHAAFSESLKIHAAIDDPTFASNLLGFSPSSLLPRQELNFHNREAIRLSQQAQQVTQMSPAHTENHARFLPSSTSRRVPASLAVATGRPSPQNHLQSQSTTLNSIQRALQVAGLSQPRGPSFAGIHPTNYRHQSGNIQMQQAAFARGGIPMAGAMGCSTYSHLHNNPLFLSNLNRYSIMMQGMTAVPSTVPSANILALGNGGRSVLQGLLPHRLMGFQGELDVTNQLLMQQQNRYVASRATYQDFPRRSVIQGTESESRGQGGIHDDAEDDTNVDSDRKYEE